MDFNTKSLDTKHIAYFSMEIGVKTTIPTYSGGLGVLAGDTLKSAADLGLPVVAMTMLYHKGYFRQKISEAGRQSESAVRWTPSKELTKVKKTVTVEVASRKVKVTAWRYDIKGTTGHIVPIYFLDTDVAGNSKYDRTLSHHLYGGDNTYRLCQEAVLGLGGVAMLEALGYKQQPSKKDKGIGTYHMNEGHAALLTVGLLQNRLGKKPLSKATRADFNAVKEKCIFTTHTPVPAGHDAFGLELAEEIVGKEYLKTMKKFKLLAKDCLNMTYLALGCSRFVNGVAKRHGEVSKKCSQDMLLAPLQMVSMLIAGLQMLSVSYLIKKCQIGVEITSAYVMHGNCH